MKSYQPFYRNHMCVKCGRCWDRQIRIVTYESGYMHEDRVYCDKCLNKGQIVTGFATPLPTEKLYDLIDQEMKRDPILNKNEVGSMHQLKDRFRTYDTALPQDWVNSVSGVMQEGNVSGHFVWVYGDRDNWGIPFPLTTKGVEILNEYEEVVNNEP